MAVRGRKHGVRTMIKIKDGSIGGKYARNQQSIAVEVTKGAVGGWKEVRRVDQALGDWQDLGRGEHEQDTRP